ncbi:MAG: NrtR DNA-binding winged helix domain-containing protein [Lachnospiraceae bacterium]
MDPYKMSKEEKAYLKTYDIAKFDRPSIATDVVVFSILNDGERDDIRKLQKKQLKVLLIKRAAYPYKDYWAMPGGFCIPGEDVIETAKRELYEETNVRDAYLKLVGVYGEEKRDPRGWIISNTFMALMDGEKCQLRAGTDAWEAKWFSLKVASEIVEKKVTNQEIFVQTDYEMIFENNESDIVFTILVRENKTFSNHHQSIHYEMVERGDLAFDHGKIILDALLCLRKEVNDNLKLAFDLMPEYFTLTNLQNAYELILDKKLLTANFRRKIADYVVETDQMIEGEGFRPAKLYKRNMEAFY